MDGKTSHGLQTAGGNKESPNHLDEDKPMHVACHWKSVHVVRHLLHKREDINKKDAEGNSPLHTALDADYCSNYRDVVVSLLEAGADFHAAGKQGLTPLHLACYHVDEDVVRLLLDRGAGVNVLAKCNYSPLVCLLNNNCYRPIFPCRNSTNFREQLCSVLLVLLDSGANVRVVDDKDNTPLHYACQWADGDVVKILISHGADVNAKNTKGNTPLHSLVLVDNCKHSDMTDTANQLITAGSDINAKNIKCRTPLEVMCDENGYYYIDLVELFVANGANDTMLLASFFKVLNMGGAEHVDRLCEHGIQFPTGEIQLCPNILRSIPISTVLCRAGMDSTHMLYRSVFCVLLEAILANRSVVVQLLSCYVRFSNALQPCQTTLFTDMITEVRQRVHAEHVNNLITEDLSIGHVWTLSLKILTVCAIRRRLYEVGGQVSILPRIKALQEALPPALLADLRLTAETEALLAVSKRLLAPRGYYPVFNWR